LRGKDGRSAYGLLSTYAAHNVAEKSLYIKAVNSVQYFHIVGVGDSSEQRKVIDEPQKADSKIIDTFLAWARIMGHDRQAK